MNLGLFFFGTLLFITSLWLMLLILVQRGKGGGLTGALGGPGGQSAFGAKAGDAFTKITTISAVIWITLCMLTIVIFNPPPAKAKGANKDAGQQNSSVSPTGDSETDGDKKDDVGGNAGDAATTDAKDDAATDKKDDPANDVIMGPVNEVPAAKTDDNKDAAETKKDDTTEKKPTDTKSEGDK